MYKCSDMFVLSVIVFDFNNRCVGFWCSKVVLSTLEGIIILEEYGPNNCVKKNSNWDT